MTADPLVATLIEWIEVSMHRSMRAFIRYVINRGLSMSHLGAMYYIHRKGSSSVTELGDYLGVTSAAASQMLERLVQQGLILRMEDPDDRRVKQVVLTGQGQQLLDESIHARQDWLEDLARTLSDDEKDTVQVALNILIDRVKLLNPAIEIERE